MCVDIYQATLPPAVDSVFVLTGFCYLFLTLMQYRLNLTKIWGELARTVDYCRWGQWRAG